MFGRIVSYLKLSSVHVHQVTSHDKRGELGVYHVTGRKVAHKDLYLPDEAKS